MNWLEPKEVEAWLVETQADALKYFTQAIGAAWLDPQEVETWLAETRAEALEQFVLALADGSRTFTSKFEEARFGPIFDVARLLVKAMERLK